VKLGNAGRVYEGAALRLLLHLDFPREISQNERRKTGRRQGPYLSTTKQRGLEIIPSKALLGPGSSWAHGIATVKDFVA